MNYAASNHHRLRWLGGSQSRVRLGAIRSLPAGRQRDLPFGEWPTQRSAIDGHEPHPWMGDAKQGIIFHTSAHAMVKEVAGVRVERGGVDYTTAGYARESVSSRTHPIVDDSPPRLSRPTRHALRCCVEEKAVTDFWSPCCCEHMGPFAAPAHTRTTANHDGRRSGQFPEISAVIGAPYTPGIPHETVTAHFLTPQASLPRHSPSGASTFSLDPEQGGSCNVRAKSPERMHPAIGEDAAVLALCRPGA